MSVQLIWVIFIFIGIGTVLGSKIIFGKEFTIREMLIVICLNTMVGGLVIFAGTYKDTYDTEILNGEVVSKSRDSVSCEHSYDCHPHTVSCGKNCTKTHYDTCYRHSNDWDYNVKTTVGSFRVQRIDERGTYIPNDFNVIIPGEPASRSHGFTNYIKAVPDSLFNNQYLNDTSVMVPDYPKIEKYILINRVLNVSSSQINTTLLNSSLNEGLKSLGPSKHVNIVVVFADSAVNNFVDVLKARWLNGKQNDVIVVVQVQGNSIIKTDAFGFAKSDLVFEEIKHSLKDLGTIDEKQIASIILSKIDTSFERKSMDDYAYLKDSIEPPTWALILAAFFSLFGSFFISYQFSKPGIDL